MPNQTEDDADDLDDAGLSKSARALVWLSDNLLLAGTGAGFALLLVGSILGIGIPRWLRVGGITGAIALVAIGRPTAKRVRGMLYSPSWVWVVDVDARESDSGAIYRIPEEQFIEFDVVDGDLDRVNPSLVFARAVDLEARELTGTWRGTLPDRELLSALSAIKECREQLEQEAKVGFKFDTQGFSIVRSAVKQATKTVVKTFETGTLPDDGDGLDAAINDALAEFGVGRDDYLSDHITETEDDADDLDDHDPARAVLHGGSFADLADDRQQEVPADD